MSESLDGVSVSATRQKAGSIAYGFAWFPPRPAPRAPPRPAAPSRPAAPARPAAPSRPGTTGGAGGVNAPAATSCAEVTRAFCRGRTVRLSHVAAIADEVCRHAAATAANRTRRIMKSSTVNGSAVSIRRGPCDTAYSASCRGEASAAWLERGFPRLFRQFIGRAPRRWLAAILKFKKLERAMGTRERDALTYGIEHELTLRLER